VPQARPDRAPGGVDAGDEEHEARGGHVPIADQLTVDRTAHEETEHVVRPAVLGGLAAGRDLLAEVLEDLPDRVTTGLEVHESFLQDPNGTSLAGRLDRLLGRCTVRSTLVKVPLFSPYVAAGGTTSASAAVSVR
jgi:hypothetical protein